MAAHDGSCPVGLTPTSSGVSDCLSSSDRTVEMIQSEELSTALRINFSMDLVFAAKRQLGFLRTIDSLPCLHKGPMVLRAIRR